MADPFRSTHSFDFCRVNRAAMVRVVNNYRSYGASFKSFIKLTL